MSEDDLIRRVRHVRDVLRRRGLLPTLPPRCPKCRRHMRKRYVRYFGGRRPVYYCPWHDREEDG